MSYGSPRVYRELQGKGIPCSENRVARLMRRHGLATKQTKRYKVTTKANRCYPTAPNMNGVGSYFDNAPMESFFGTLKQELVHQRYYQTRA